jgi:sugar phosphate isomerase/epimerase
LISHALAAAMPTKSGGIPTCYASCSIGHKPEHDLPAKLKAISEAGFDAIELSMPDLVSFANEKLKKEVGPKDFDDLCQVGAEVKKLCQEYGLTILILQPFANFEGWGKGSVEAKDAMERAEGWMRIMESVGTDMLQVREPKCEFRVPPLSALARLTKRDPGRIV